MEDTIAAISTAIGEGAISIVRLSGMRAIEIANKIFISRRGNPSTFKTHTIHFGSIGESGKIIDQVMLTVLRAPRTYTTEDMIEINCHGGYLTARSILSLCLSQGARLAEPGEFTKRAFLNGRIDLTQAEAVADLIRAKTERAHTIATYALEGNLSKVVKDQREQLINILAYIEAQIDFPEENLHPNDHKKLILDIDNILHVLRMLLDTERAGKIVREGISVAIVGRPNVGKSSLMNALLGHERSIVTHLPGTTRDTVEEMTNIRGIPVRITDTAGIRKARNIAEEQGVLRSRNALAQNELIIHVIDASRPFSETDYEISDHYNGKLSIVVENKIDLRRRLILPPFFQKMCILRVSSFSCSGIDKLKEEIESLVWKNNVGNSHIEIAINERQSEAIRVSEKHLAQAKQHIIDSESPEIITQSLRIAADTISELIGDISSDDILEKVFSNFCIGK